MLITDPRNDPGRRLPLDISSRVAAPWSELFADTIIEQHENTPPDMVIGDPANPYMLRWYIGRDATRGAVYLHHILRSDDDRALHDHPYANTSIILDGSYVEVVAEPDADPAIGPFVRHRRQAGDILMRPAHYAHRLEVAAGETVWTLFACGPVEREWGFHCPQGWRRWQDFVDRDNPGAVGRGCAD